MEGKKFLVNRDKFFLSKIFLLLMRITISNLNIFIINNIENQTYSTLPPQLSDSTRIWTHTAEDSIIPCCFFNNP